MNPLRNLIIAAAFDPFQNVSPSWGPFDQVMGSKVGMLIGLAWAISFCVLAFFLMEGIVRAGKARRSGYADAYEEARSALAWPAVGVIALAVLPIVYGVLAS